MPPRAPLGVLCAGECHAGPEPRPADHELCNFGYARGAITVLVSDLAGRVFFEPREVPVGVITALVGAPVYFFWLRGRPRHG